MTIAAWLDSLKDHLPPNYPLEAVKDAIVLVMKKNIFEWGDKYFLQLLDTVMGTSTACIWTRIYFAVHKTQYLIPTYSANLLVYKLFIDNIFGTWIPSKDRHAWQKFKDDTNNFGILTWEFKELTSSINFLDLTISIKNS